MILRKNRFFFLAVVLVSALLVIIFSNNSLIDIRNTLISPTPFPTITTSNDVNEDPSTISPASSQNIEVLSPRTGDKIKNGAIVKGNARVFENVVSIRLFDSAGNVLIQTTAYANAPDVGQFGPFEKELKFETNYSEGTLEVYQSSAKDGSEIDKVTIPVVFN